MQRACQLCASRVSRSEPIASTKPIAIGGFLLIYRLLLTALSPLFALLMLRQLLRGRERLSDLTERFGADLSTRPTSCAPKLWVHGASNGELTGARALIEEALRRAPGLEVLVTTNTVTARKMVRDWALPRVTVRLAPFDLRPVLRRFIRATQPAALVSIENEIWPNRFALLARNAIPVIVAGARMSDRSAQRWEKMAPFFGGVIRPTIAAITRLAAQDTASEQRLLQLGLPPAALLPKMNLKSTVDIDISPLKNADPIAAQFDRATTVLAASTHPGEERPVLEAFHDLRQTHPHARLILAPRHPARADSIATELTRAGFAFARRSKGDTLGDAPVYLADSLGEMPLWYGLSGISFIGGSLINLGGHTPFEPAQCGTAILHGPFVSNHMSAYRALDTAGAAIEITDAATLAEAVRALMNDPPQTAAMAEAAHAALAPLRGAAAQQEAFWAALADVPKLQALR